jgi:hypothetical protein
VNPKQRAACLHDYHYSLSLMASTRNIYYSDHEESS